MINENLDGCVGANVVVMNAVDSKLSALGLKDPPRSSVLGLEVGVDVTGAIEGIADLTKLGEADSVSVGAIEAVGDTVGVSVTQRLLTQLFLPPQESSHSSKSVKNLFSSQYSVSRGASSLVQKNLSTDPGVKVGLFCHS